MTIRGSRRPIGTVGFDLRTKEARLMARTRQRLTLHVGGSPTATEAAHIERACMLTAHLARLDSEALRTGIQDLERYLSLSNALARTLDRLGTKAVIPEPPSLAAYLTSRASEDAA